MTNNDEQNKKSEVALREEELLQFWDEKEIFKKSLEKPAPNGNYVFYDGPPFATGLPHHGHILASTIKDVIPRYQTMQGKHVERRWGWDTHGLPIENIVEKNLNISGKKEVEKIGIETFNKEARSQVLEFVDGWKKTVNRIARWVDFDGAYLTMSNDYIESVWWALNQVNEKGLLYEGEKVLPYCPRCETPIANSEIAMDNSYQDITDISVTAKFELTDEPNTFLLAWTTTPWTLPGNVAAAVHSEIVYVKCEVTNKEDEKEFVIFAKERIEYVLKDKEYTVVAEFLGSELIGKSYIPVFDYYKNVDLKNKENIWKVWNADYVNTEQGTGIVHLAPVYGEEDMELAKKVSLPLIFHVQQDGRFAPEVKDFAGMLIKEKGNHQAADIEIIKFLAHNGTLFAKEKIIHSYPHCFRCDTPLFYNSLSAWFINIQKVKDRALELNNEVAWIPEHLKEGRFKKSMEGAPDWNISRNRYWASPLPFWKPVDAVKGTDDVIVLGSLADLKEKTKGTGSIFMMRHGEAEHNVSNTISGSNDTPSHLTEKGKAEAKEAVAKLKDKNIDVIVASPLFRTQETAAIIAEGLGLDASAVITDERIVETQTGLEGHPIDEYRSCFKNNLEKFTRACDGGETLTEMKNRVGDFLYEIHETYKDKNILIVGHEYVAWMLDAVTAGDTAEQAAAKKELQEDFVATGEVRVLDFAPIPHNENYELDFHRPYIDDVVFEVDGKTYKRVPEVVDCWVESGSMPFAQKHYPFENKTSFEENFPAQFVAEYIAQTRTWFYYSHMMSTILFDSIPFENIVTTGNVMAEDGTKMSKSKNNFPDPWLMFNKYGVDAERYYLLSSPVVQSEDMYFSEKIVDEVYKKLIMRLRNVVAFYELQNKEDVHSASVRPNSENVLDGWIIARLDEVVKEVTNQMEQYRLDKATKPIMLFVDDLSTWYVRRSRDRFKDATDDAVDALQTLRFVLLELAKVLAPFTPFIAEDIHQRLHGEEESVHLASWPVSENTNSSVVNEMNTLRDVVTSALEARTKTGIKVRQPLASLTLKNNVFEGKENYLEILKDELNVKEILFSESQAEDVLLDTVLTSALQAEGNARELIRAIQQTRKQAKLSPDDEITLTVSENGKELVQQFEDEISKTAKVKEFVFGEVEGGVDVKIEEEVVQIKIS